MARLLQFTFCGLVLIINSLTFSSAAEAFELKPPKSMGQVIPNFHLPNHQGKLHYLKDYADQKLVVIAFLGTECPLAKLYSLRLSALAEEYGPRGVAVIGIDANRQDSLAEIGNFVRTQELKFPLLKDAGNRVADYFGAVRTPEVFVLDQERTVRYYGRIDDQYGIGYAKEAPSQKDLAMALDELLDGKPVSNPLTQPIGCHIGRMRKPQPDSKVTYSNQISRLLAKHCVDCHRPGEVAPFSLTDYEEVAGWAAMMNEVVQEERMPPWHANPAHGEFSNDRRLTKEEKELFHAWMKAGAPEGDPSELPEPTEYVSGWNLPQEPDLIIPMSKKPYKVAREGVIQYQHFHVDPKFTEEKWVSAVDVRPGNRAVVHHILVMIHPPGVNTGTLADLDGQILGLFVPGMRSEPWPEGTAKRLPAGCKVSFEIHYTPIGTPQEDCSEIGIIFADPEKVKRAVISCKAVQQQFAIPPHDSNYRAEVLMDGSPMPLELLSMMPHMHLRGKSFKYEAIYPDGSREILLDIPKYDYNWQTSYRLAKPKVMAAGSRIQCVAHFDNSKHNLANPDPTETVRWGAQSWHEMMIGYFQFSVPVEYVSQAEFGTVAQATMPAAHTVADRALQHQATTLMRHYDKNGDGRLSITEMPPAQHAAMNAMDCNHDGSITIDELYKSMRGK